MRRVHTPRGLIAPVAAALLPAPGSAAAVLPHSAARVDGGGLGRMDELEASGPRARLTQRLARLTEEVVAMRPATDLEARSAQPLGGLLLLEKPWWELGLDGMLRRVGRRRRVEFDLERAVFARVANRVLDLRSKRGIRSWLETPRVQRSLAFMTAR